MMDRIFSAALTFCLLAGGTLAIGSAMFGGDQRPVAPHVRVVQLERVVIVGKRLAPATVATSDATESASQRVQ